MNDSESRAVTIPADGVQLEGTLTIPAGASAIILFAHGSGSSRFSPRNQQVARQLNEAGFATLLFDLLSAAEHDKDAVTAAYRFNIALLSKRLVAAIDWTDKQDEIRDLPVGLFGASTGAAAALVAAAELPESVCAVVSRGGRPDLAGARLPHVKAPTLLIVGGWDSQVEELNVLAGERMTAPNELVIVPEATHLFEEPGKLEEVAAHAVQWFELHCRSGHHPGQATEAQGGSGNR